MGKGKCNYPAACVLKRNARAVAEETNDFGSDCGKADHANRVDGFEPPIWIPFFFDKWMGNKAEKKNKHKHGQRNYFDIGSHSIDPSRLSASTNSAGEFSVFSCENNARHKFLPAALPEICNDRIPASPTPGTFAGPKCRVSPTLLG